MVAFSVSISLFRNHSPLWNHVWRSICLHGMALTIKHWYFYLSHSFRLSHFKVSWSCVVDIIFHSRYSSRLSIGILYIQWDTLTSNAIQCKSWRMSRYKCLRMAQRKTFYYVTDISQSLYKTPYSLFAVKSNFLLFRREFYSPTNDVAEFLFSFCVAWIRLVENRFKVVIWQMKSDVLQYMLCWYSSTLNVQ